MHLVDAIVPLYNESLEPILITVKGLNSQTRNIRRIILVDDGSTRPPDYGTIASDSRIPIEVLRLPVNSGISAARNHAARNSDAEFFLFVNCGIELLPEWTEKTVNFLETRSDVGLACGPISSKKSTLCALWHKQHLLRNNQAWINKTQELIWAVGFAITISAKCLWRVGGWDERLKRAGEDGALSRSLRQAGLKIYQVEGALGLDHEHQTVRILAGKTIRNLGWSLDPDLNGDGFLRPLRLWPAAKEFAKRSLSQLARNSVKGQWNLLPIDFAVMGCGTYLIFRTALQLRRRYSTTCKLFGDQKVWG